MPTWAPRVAALVAWLPCAARAEPAAAADARTSVYQDTDHTQIRTGTVSVSVPATARLTVEGRYLIDAISAASVDVVTAATPKFTENRHEGEGRVAFADGTHTLSLTYVRSIENDWWSHNVDAGAARDFLGHDLTVALGYGGTWNRVGRNRDPNFHERLDVHGGTASATWVLSPVSLVQGTLSVSHAQGFQASPYRFVAIGPAGLHLPEADPEGRWRVALVVRGNRHVGHDTALQAHARGYGDDWGVRSLTVGAALLQGGESDPRGGFSWGLRVRGYGQLPADFYRRRYDAPQRYMTFDRELGTFVDVFAGPELGWRRRFAGGLIDEVRAAAKVEGFWFKFFDFDPLPTRSGVVADLALGVSL